MLKFDFENWGLPESVLTAIKGLLDDPRNHELSTPLDNRTLRTIAEEYYQALSRDSWDKKTQAAREAWL